MKVLQIQAEIRIPDVPDFFLLTNGQKLPISAVKQDSLRAVGEGWTKNLLTKAGKKPGNPGKPRRKKPMRQDGKNVPAVDTWYCDNCDQEIIPVLIDGKESCPHCRSKFPDVYQVYTD